jgi:acyl carrier protein
MIQSEIVTVKGILSSISELSVSIEDIRETHLLSDDLGVDSLQMIRLVLELEERLQRKVFDVDNIANVKTVGDVIELLK